ncbi:MAG: type II toxin-antitoxin system VapB family antitoxin [bacterium]|nr:type II toxin-antitoxin system VapB family antitoxin [bacterium]
MRTTIVVDDELMQKAMKSTGLKTRQAVVEAGLRLLVQVHAQTDIRKLRGKITWEGGSGRDARGPCGS